MRLLSTLGLALLVALCGCGPSGSPVGTMPAGGLKGGGVPAPPPPRTGLSAELPGLSLADLKKRLGPPDREQLMDRAPDFGPWPADLQAGEQATYVYYQNHQGEQVNVYLVSPEVYTRIHGARPGDDAWYVLEVFTYPQGTVF